MGYSPGSVDDARLHSVADIDVEVYCGYIEVRITDEVTGILCCLNVEGARKLAGYLELLADMLEKGTYQCPSPPKNP
jgi:hypothetical protein